jgi:hypothetical protein
MAVLCKKIIRLLPIVAPLLLCKKMKMRTTFICGVVLKKEAGAL